MTLLAEEILGLLMRSGHRPVKRRELARKLDRDPADISLLAALEELVDAGKLSREGENAYRLGGSGGRLVGIFRRRKSGGGMVAPRSRADFNGPPILIAAKDALDASHGDTVVVELPRRRSARESLLRGRVVQILERADKRFVGIYRTRRGHGVVRVGGSVFGEPIPAEIRTERMPVDGDRVVVEVVAFPKPHRSGKCEVIEVLGPAGDSAADALSVIRQYRLPDVFDDEVLAEAEAQARSHSAQQPGADRVDWTAQTVITIDPADAHDFDDAVSVDRDERGYWRLGVHIADVAHFVRPNSALDREARKRGTSVYLPQRVLPMLPDRISSNLASLLEGETRLTKSVVVEFDPEGRRVNTEFQNSAIRVSKRLNYEEAASFFADTESGGEWAEEIRQLLSRMRELASLLRRRRREQGMIELSMPETELEYDEAGKVSGAHYRPELESHKVIEEFMVTANEAVAEQLRGLGVAFVRRVHPDPDPRKIENFAEFVQSLGMATNGRLSRFDLQRILREAGDGPMKQAVHYGFLRSMKEAVYSSDDLGHYALASECYCHFTSPIRRYPDLIVHRMLDQWLRTGKAGFDRSELAILAEHCSHTERRAAKAERELIKLKLLDWLAQRIGENMDGVVTGVEEYGLFVQGERIPAEGLVSVRGLPHDFYLLERATHSLVGRRSGNRFQLGQRVRTRIARVDVEARMVDLEFIKLVDASQPSNVNLRSPTKHGREKRAESQRRRNRR